MIARPHLPDPTRPTASILLTLFECPDLAVGFPALTPLSANFDLARQLADRRPDLNDEDFYELLGACGIAFPRLFLHALTKVGGLGVREAGAHVHRCQRFSSTISLFVCLSATAAQGRGGKSLETLGRWAGFREATIKRHRARLMSIMPGYKVARTASRRRGAIILGDHQFPAAAPEHWGRLIWIAARLGGQPLPTDPWFKPLASQAFPAAIPS